MSERKHISMYLSGIGWKKRIEIFGKLLLVLISIAVVLWCNQLLKPS